MYHSSNINGLHRVGAVRLDILLLACLLAKRLASCLVNDAR